MVSVHGLDEACVRFGRNNDESGKSLINSATKESFITSLFVIPFIAVAFFTVDIFSALPLYTLATLAVWIIADALLVPYIAYARSVGKATHVAVVLVIQGIVTWILTYIALTYLYASINGILLSYAAASIIPLVILTINSGAIKTLFANSRPDFPAIRKYALPAGIVSVVAIAVNFSDRYIIALFCSTHETGLYSAGFKIGMIISMSISAIRMAWYPSAYRQMEESSFEHNTGNSLFARESILIITCIGMLAIVISFFRNQIGAIEILGKPIIAAEYREGLVVIPVIALAYVFDGAATLADTLLYFKQRMAAVLKISLLSLFVKLALCIILIRHFGIMGAAISTLAAFILQAVAFETVNRRVLKLSVLSVKHWAILSIISALVILSMKYSINNYYVLR
jgi:O-antigen/teichoic acid export membrane protein